MRIVSLCPSLTELVFDLGRGAELVGITEWCVHPADRVGAVEKVGGTKSPQLARIVELAPDLVLMNEEENRREDAEALRTAGLAIHASLPRDTAGTAAMVRSIAGAIDACAEGERIARDIEERTARVVLAAREKPRVRWAYLIWRKPWMSVNRDTFVSALLDQAGGVNVFGLRSERYPVVEAKELAAARPEIVLLCSEPFPFQERHAEELATSTGLARETFVFADGELLSWHGSRTPRGIDYAAGLLDRARG
ncbi:MAG: ABC transporter substrate-binding protein [Planctomycetes bacterium]|nr:ABC transporter substrate-binding protein [Planctomycetota bacterium]